MYVCLPILLYKAYVAFKRIQASVILWTIKLNMF